MLSERLALPSYLSPNGLATPRECQDSGNGLSPLRAHSGAIERHVAWNSVRASMPILLNSMVFMVGMENAGGACDYLRFRFVLIVLLFPCKGPRFI